MYDFLYPEIEPYSQKFLEVEHPHKLYVEECGNPKGKPVIFIHGGPGAGCSADDRRFFNPEKYRIILFDQRGCGRSRPLCSLDNNTTPHLISDIEAIRRHLGIERWIVFGGSWGSTLSLLYAQAHHQHVTSLILRGIFLGKPEEFQHLNQCGMKRFYPEEYQAYQSFIPENARGDLHRAYYGLLQSDDQTERYKAAESFTNWDMRCVSISSFTPIPIDDENDDGLVAAALIQCHYMVNGCFLEPGQIMKNANKISHVPTVIVHGRYDLLCAPQSAYELHKLLPGSELHLTQNSGHASRDPGTGQILVAVMDALAAEK